ncbi:MAG: TPMT family class I SAM-dependent methyltransferase [Flavobacteriales bacterium]|nr:TPMT family class I SAM-dependent methyltransferase [Flavobacteriales bacterium]
MGKILGMSEKLDLNYWDQRWQEGRTEWDIGYPSPALMEFARQFPLREQHVLIPGCGNAYEAEALLELGYTHITLLDISPTLTTKLRQRFGFASDKIQVVCEDFFLHEGRYDLILEQTFFCALPPCMRPQYVKKMAELLNPNGRLAGLLFITPFDNEGPPFGGTFEEYQQLFGEHFHILRMELTPLSIPQRQGREVFFEATVR